MRWGIEQQPQRRLGRWRGRPSEAAKLSFTAGLPFEAALVFPLATRRESGLSAASARAAAIVNATRSLSRGSQWHVLCVSDHAAAGL